MPDYQIQYRNVRRHTEKERRGGFMFLSHTPTLATITWRICPHLEEREMGTSAATHTVNRPILVKCNTELTSMAQDLVQYLQNHLRLSCYQTRAHNSRLRLVRHTWSSGLRIFMINLESKAIYVGTHKFKLQTWPSMAAISPSPLKVLRWLPLP